MIRNRLLSVAGVLLSLGAVTTACGDGEADVGGGGQGGEGTGGSGTGGSGTGGSGTGGGGPLECPGEQVLCSAECVTLANNRDHCGACDTACGTGELCVAGGCEDSCTGALLACGLSCIDPKTDPDYCGATNCGATTGVGVACASDETCDQGVCNEIPSAWHPGARVDDATSSIDEEQAIATDSAGNAIVVYRQLIDSTNIQTGRTFARFYDVATSSWLPAVQLDQGSLRVRNPQVAMSADGDAIAIWISGPITGAASVQAAFFNGQTRTWSATQRLDDQNTVASNPSVALDADGDGFVAWSQDLEGGGDRPRIIVSSWNGSAFSTATPLPAIGDSQAYFPRVAINDAGLAGLAWEEFDIDGGSLGVYAPMASVYDGNAWSAPVDLRTEDDVLLEAYGRYPDVGIDDAGNVTVVYARDIYLADVSIFASVYTATGTPGWAPAAAAESVSVPATDPRLVVDRAGLATLVFQVAAYDGSGELESYADIYGGRRVTGSWSTSAVVSDVSPGQRATPQVSADENGAAVAFWLNTIDATFKVMTSRYIGTAWGTPVVLNAGVVNAGAAFSPSLAISPSGDGFASWVQALPGVQTLYVSKFD